MKLFLDGVSYAQDGQRIQVEHLNLDFPWNAFRDGIWITSLEADGVSVDIRSAESPAAPGAAAAGSPPPRIQIDQLNIRNATLSYTTPTTVIRIPSLSLEASDGRGVLRLDQPVSIGPETNVAVAELRFVLADNSVRFGPATWRIDYAKYAASGSAQGVFRWSPALALETEIATDPITIEKWKDIRVNGTASYANGVLDVSEFRAVQGSGNVAGSARISNAGTSADISWKDVDLNPSGVSGRSDGMLNLKWQAADLNDLTAQGNARLNSRQYGTVETTVQIANNNASFDIRAKAMDLAIRSRLTTRLDQVLAGSFKELRANVNGTIQPLSTSAAYEKLGTVNISANGAFRDNVLTVRDIHARSKGSDASDVTFQVNLASRRIRGRVPQVRIALGDLAPDVMGTANLTADIDGTIDRPTASFKGSSTGIDIGSTHIDDVRLDGSLANDPAGVRELHGTLSGTVHPMANNGTQDAAGKVYRGFESIKASAAGTFRDNIVTVDKIQAESSASNLSDATFQVNLNDRRIQGSIPQIRIDLNALAPDIVGIASLAADIEGTIDQPVGTFTGSSSGIDIGSNHIDSMDLEGTLAKDVLKVTRLEAHQADGVLNASGQANLTTEQLDALFDVSDLKVVPVADLSATVFANGQVGGTYRSPDIDFSGELREVVYQQEAHGTIRVDGETNLAIVTVRATSDKYSASVTGEVDLKPPYFFTAGLVSSNSQIHYEKYDLAAEGRVRVSGQAQPFKAEHLQFENFEVRTQGVELSVDGSMDTGTRLDLKVDLPKLPIEDIELTGTARALATLSGTLNDPSIEGTLSTDGVKVRAMEMKEAADVSAQVDFTGQDFSVRDLHASLAGATATITGHGSWTGASQLQFRVENLRPENFVQGRPVSGVAGIEGEIDFRSLNLDGMSGSARVTDLDLKIRDMAIHQTQPIEAEFRNQVLTVRNFEIEGLDTRAKVTGYANLIERTLNFDADANTDLAILEPLIPNAHPDGRVNTRIALRGTLDKPDFDGFINLSGGELAIDRPDVLLSEVDAEAQFRGNRIEINHASGLFNGGRFEATGGTGIAAAGLQDAALRFTVERGQLDYPEGLQSEFTAQLAVDGSMPTLTVTGSIDVLNAIYQKNFSVTQQLFARITSQAQGVSAAKATISDQIRMEVEVRTPGPITVKNNVADLEALGSFRIRGTVANPIILGRADVQDGGELYFGAAVSQTLETTQRND
ncbi:MAG TPA: AsmA-like C-terminal region-containing protein, partial [Terriglobia bacterium]|nr:AsmA-like C-terminal region-containing protein [Terriglobia bacterium]